MEFNYNLPYTHSIEPILTQKCNLNCTYCFEGCKRKEYSDLNVDEFLEKVVKQGYYDVPELDFYLMGGEPLIALPQIKELYEKIETNKNLEEGMKQRMLRSITESLTTNGTLLDKDTQWLKEKGFNFQISLDGPEDVNDKCRIDHSGHGQFKKIEKNTELLDKEGMLYSIHGAIARNNYSRLADIVEFHLKYKLKRFPLNKLKGNKEMCYRILNSNCFMYVIEDDITDEDIDTLLDAHIELYDRIMKTPLLDGLTDDERKYVLLGFVQQIGGPCAAGKTLMTMEANYKAYGCHRIASASSKTPLEFWNAEEGFVNTDKYYLFAHPFTKDYISSTWFTCNRYTQNNRGFNKLMWCPSTNYLYTHEIPLMPPRYATMMAELKEFTKKFISFYDLRALDRYR